MTKRNGTRQARCHLSSFDEIECRIPFHAALIEAWKQEIPFKYRSYDPDSKAWRFDGDYREHAVALLLRWFPDAELPVRFRPWDRSTRDPRVPRQSPNDRYFEVLHLRDSAPIELVNAAFRCLA